MRTDANEKCRICDATLARREGKTNYVSIENLYVISRRKEYSGPEFQDLQNKTLAEICRELGFDFAQSDELKRNFFQTNFPLCAIRSPQLERRTYAALARSFW